MFWDSQSFIPSISPCGKPEYYSCQSYACPTITYVWGRQLATLVSLVHSWRGIVPQELYCMAYTQEPHTCLI